MKLIMTELNIRALVDNLAGLFDIATKSAVISTFTIASQIVIDKREPAVIVEIFTRLMELADTRPMEPIDPTVRDALVKQITEVMTSTRVPS